MQAPPDESTVLALVRDLMFIGRITALAGRLGAHARVIRDPAQLAPGTPGQLLLVDLDLDGALAAAVAWRGEGDRQVAGFVQHVNTERIREARAAGIDTIIPRSRLDAALPSLLSGPPQDASGAAGPGIQPGG